MNVKVQNWILKRVQNDVLVMPNQVLNLIQDLRISASHLNFGFDLTFELCRLTV
jgi:predicted RNA methylase